MIFTPALIAATLLTVASGYFAVTSRCVRHSALHAAVAFLGVGLLYLLLSAPFLAAVQVLAFTGGLSALSLLAVRGLSGRDRGRPWAGHVARIGAGLACLAMFAVLGWWAPQQEALAGGRPPAPDGARQLDLLVEGLVGRYFLPLEIVAILIVAALVALTALSRDEQSGA